MATTVNYGWLKDKNNNKFAPKTLSSQIVTNEGKSFEDEIKQQISSVSTSTNGIIVTITTDGWNLQSDGTYKKIITITELTGNETLDMCLYPGDTHTQEQIIAYCEKITSVDIEAGKLILIASEALTVSFRVFLYGKIDIDEDSIVALNDNVLEVKTVTQEYYNSLPESEKAKGIYITDGDDLTAKNIYYDGSETGLGNTVQGAIDKLNSNFDNRIGFPNYSRVLDSTTLKASSASYTATENCWLIGYIEGGSTVGTPEVYVDGVRIAMIYAKDHSKYNTMVCVPIKKGSVITTRGNNTGAYSLSVYAMM